MLNDIRRRPEGALFRTYLTAAGITPDSFEKPLIGVATVATQVFKEKPAARELGTAALSGIEAAGGIAVRWDTARSPEQMAWGHAESYSFAWRDQLADMIESWSKQQALDGIVLVGDAPETLVGMAMSAARLNLPAMIITSGISRGELNQAQEGEKLKSKGLRDPFEQLAEILFLKKKDDKNGSTSVEQLTKCFLFADDHAAYAVDLVLEGLGVCLPGMATAPAQSPKRQELSYATGQRIISLVKNGVGFRRVLTANAFANAIRLNASLGGSIDVAVHLMALAHEAGVPLSLDLFDKISNETPQLCHLGGVAAKHPHSIDDLDQAGGVWAIFHALKSQISPTTTLSGKGAMELAKSNVVKDSHVIHENRVIRKKSGLGVLKGNLSPHGAVFLLNQTLPEFGSIKSNATIFENEIEAAQAVSAGQIKKGAIIVVRGQGPKGGPGLTKLRILPALLENRGLNESVALITDGRLPETPSGLLISLVSPEGAVKGPLGILKNGDLVEIDIQMRKIMVRLTDTELRIRLARWQMPEPKSKKGFLNRYSKSVSEVHEGAVLK